MDFLFFVGCMVYMRGMNVLHENVYVLYGENLWLVWRTKKKRNKMFTHPIALIQVFSKHFEKMNKYYEKLTLKKLLYLRMQSYHLFGI